MRYYIELGFSTIVDSPEALDAHTDALMEALMDEPGATDADVLAELATGKVVISMYIEADDDRDAMGRALLVARSAIHKAGGFTGGWTERVDGGLEVGESYNLRVQPDVLVDH